MDINFNNFGDYEYNEIYLCNPDKKQLFVIDGTEANLTLRLNDLSEFTINVHKIVQNHKGEQIVQPCYDYLCGKRLILIDKIGYFVIRDVTEHKDSDGEYKSITAQSHQAILRDKGFDEENRVYRFYNSADPLDDDYNSSDISSVPSVVGQLHKQLGIEVDLQYNDITPATDYEKWTITYIDDTLRYGDSVHRTLNENVTNGYDFMINDVEEAFEIIWIFDFLHHTIKAKHINLITSQTDIYLSFDNLLQSIEVTENADDIVTVLNCHGSDIDISTVNPMGTNYIVNFDYYKDNTGKWMSSSLIDALDAWEVVYDNNKSSYTSLVTLLRLRYEEQTKIQNKITSTQLKVDELSRARDQYISNFPILAETVRNGTKSLDTNSQYHLQNFSIFDIFTCYRKSPTYENGSYVFSSLSRQGTLIENFVRGYIYFQDADTNTYCKMVEKENNTLAFERYGEYSKIISWCDCKETSNIIISSESINIGDYSLDSDSVFYNNAFTKGSSRTFTCYEDAPVLSNGVFVGSGDYIEDTLDNCANEGYLYFLDGSNKTYCKISMSADIDENNNPIYYASGFLRFTTILNAPEWISLQEDYCADLNDSKDDKQNQINTIISSLKAIADVCNIRKYIASVDDEQNTLSKELECYWIEGDYENTNIVATDNTTMEQTIDLANELLDAGKTQLEKVSQPLFSFTIESIDFLKNKHFTKFANQLQLGRVISVEKEDGIIYYPAVTEFSFDLHDTDNFTITFSNSAKLNNNEFTFADLVVNSSKVSKAVKSNWDNLVDYARHKEEIGNLISNPLDMALRAGLANTTNQEFTIDTTGILGRKYSDDSHASFVDEQMRIMNNTILFTDDNWSTIKTALGKIYYTIDGVEHSAYGLVAQTIIGSLMMSETLDIKNSNSSVILDKDGIRIKHGTDTVLTADTSGNLSVKGHVVATSGTFTGRIEAGEGYIGNATNGFTINSDTITHNLDDANTRVIIGTGTNQRTYNLFGEKGLSNFVLLAGSGFGVTQTGQMYADGGKIARLNLEQNIYTSTVGDYVKINGNLTLYSALQKYLEIYAIISNPEDYSNVYVYLPYSGEYVLAGSLVKYNETYTPSNDGTYIRINNTYVLLEDVEKYIDVYTESPLGNYVKINNAYVLGSSLTRYSQSYQESASGIYVYINNNYVIGSSLTKYNKVYTEDANGLYVFVNNDYVLGSTLDRYKQGYEEDVDGEYILNDGEYIELNTLVRYSYDSETSQYIEDVSGTYVYVNSDYVLISSLTKYSIVYELDSNGTYVCVNSQYVLYSSLTKYNLSYQEAVDGLYVNINQEYVLYSSLTKYNQVYIQAVGGAYVNVNSEYVLYSSLTKYVQTYELNENGTFVYDGTDQEYKLISELTKYFYDYDIYDDINPIRYSTLSKYIKQYQQNSSGDYIFVNGNYVDTSGNTIIVQNQYIKGERLLTYNSSGEPATNSIITYGIFGSGFRIESKIDEEHDDEETLLAFTEPITDEIKVLINKNGIEAPEAKFNKLTSTEFVRSETFKTNAGLIINGSKIAYTETSTADGSYLMFGYTAADTLYYAKLWWNWWERVLRLSICDENGNDTINNTGHSLNFTVHYAVIWGGDTVWNATVAAGASGTTIDTKAFWGIDYATFSSPSVDKNNRKIPFRDGNTTGTPGIGINGNLIPTKNNQYSLGATSAFWSNIYAQTSSIGSSDRNLKHDINILGDKYEKLFDKLQAVSYKFNSNTSGRTHTGLIANDVKSSLEEVGLTTKEFAAYCEWINENGETECGLRYEEFIALCINEIQKLKARVAELEEEQQK